MREAGLAFVGGYRGGTDRLPWHSLLGPLRPRKGGHLCRCLRAAVLDLVAVHPGLTNQDLEIQKGLYITVR